MMTRQDGLKKPLKFEVVSQTELPSGRKGKHHSIIGKILSELDELEAGRALKIPLSELQDTKANVRSALNRASKLRKMEVCTSSDDHFLYVWLSKAD